jgi:hypothetical protein
MKTKMIIGVALVATILVCFNGKANTLSTIQIMNPIAQSIAQAANTSDRNLSGAPLNITVSIKDIVSSYLQLKNALAEDNSSNAAKAGALIQDAFKRFNKTTLTSDQKKIFEDVESDAMENAEHISKSGGNIAHQREHFELLSKDIYDLVKAFVAGQVLYKDYDPMVNNGKGAFWLSETKEIRNPYMGKVMLKSGSVREELK